MTKEKKAKQAKKPVLITSRNKARGAETPAKVIRTTPPRSKLPWTNQYGDSRSYYKGKGKK